MFTIDKPINVSVSGKMERSVACNAEARKEESPGIVVFKESIYQIVHYGIRTHFSIKLFKKKKTPQIGMPVPMSEYLGFSPSLVPSFS